MGTRNSRLTQTVRYSAIGQHLLDNPECTYKYSYSWFSIFANIGSPKLLHIAEAYILNCIDRLFADRSRKLFVLFLYWVTCESIYFLFKLTGIFILFSPSAF